MDVLSAIQGRNIQEYSSQPIEDTKLNKVLEAARLSPSANNRQAWKFIVVKDNETKVNLAEAADGQLFMGHAPAILVACGTDPDSIMMCGQYRYTVDLPIATAYMILEAYEQGLDTC